MEQAGIETAAETRRGLDHGVFIPFMLIYPNAEIPIVQLSLQTGLSPERHLAIGRALAPLREEGVLIVGSGMTFHNLREGPSSRAITASNVFDTWLTDTLTGSPAERDASLARWADAPGGRLSHPREEHLLPLMVAAGAAEDDPAQCIYSKRLGGMMTHSGYRFG